MPEKGLEPLWISPHAPETCASTISPLRHTSILIQLDLIVNNALKTSVYNFCVYICYLREYEIYYLITYAKITRYLHCCVKARIKKIVLSS